MRQMNIAPVLVVVRLCVCPGIIAQFEFSFTVYINFFPIGNRSINILVKGEK